MSTVADMNSSESTAYAYVSLAHTDSIRLIELQPGATGTPLACKLIDARKSENPQYEAISYAWGEPVFPHTIEELSSASALRLTVSLHGALQALRYEQDPRVLWADALCINQLDLKEKGHQVALMGPIFQDAQRVIVWLGPLKAVGSRIATILEDLIQAWETWKTTGPHKQPLSMPVGIWRPVLRLSAMKLLQQPW
jgi:hypothetical protein